MPDKFDPYREALVMETSTIWREGMNDLDGKQKQQIAAALHADPEQAGHLQYVRTHTGFCRQITVQPEDVDRLRS